MPVYEIVEYVASNGSLPVTQWLEQVRDLRARSKVLIAIKRAELGNLGDHHGVGKGVMEMRINYGPGYRVYFAQARPGLLLLLTCGTKRSQHKDVVRARTYWDDFKRRQGSWTFAT